MKNKLVLVLAMLVGVLAFWLSARYLEKERAKLYKGAQKINVIVAKTDIPAMTELRSEDLGLKLVYKSAVGDNVFLPEDFDRIKGKRLKYPLDRNEPVWWTHVDMPREVQSGLSSIVKEKRRAMSIAISGAAAVSGLVKPNDHVDILGTFTFPSRINPNQVETVTLTLMQNITVLATGSQLARQNTESGAVQQSGYNMMTFDLGPEQVEILVFAQQTRGQLYLSLRNPNDVSRKEELPSVNFDYLEATLKEIQATHDMDMRTTTPLDMRTTTP